MSVGFTIPMARALLAIGRAPEVARMLLPLLESDAAAGTTLSRREALVVRSLLARIYLLNDEDVERARTFLGSVAAASTAEVGPDARAEAALWTGWCALLSGDPDQRGTASLHFALAAHLVARRGAPETALWCDIGRARLAMELGHTVLSAHFAARARQIQQAIRSAEADRRLATLPFPGSSPRVVLSDVLGVSDAMRTVKESAVLAVGAGVPTFIHGESGSGRRHLARAIHTATGRDARLFRVIRPEAQTVTSDDGVFETPSAPDERRTVCLQDVERLPIALQRRAADAARRGVIRLVSTSTADFVSLFDGGQVDRSVLEACSLLHVQIPPLRRRTDDIELLVRHFLRAMHTEGALPAAVTDDALAVLHRCAWPGNVRQLRNEVERALVHVQSEPAPVIRASVLSPDVRGTDATGEAAIHEDGDLDRILSQTEKVVIESALAQHAGQVAASADALGLTRQGLYKKMKRLGVDPSRFQNGRGSIRSGSEVPEESHYG